MKYALILTAVLTACEAASACTLGAHLATYHFDRSAHYNEFNPGAYVICDGYTAGTYYSSERTHAYYAGYTLQSGPWALTLGAVAGYPRGTLPMAVPSVRVAEHVRVAFLPPLPGAGKNTGGLHLMAEF